MLKKIGLGLSMVVLLFLCSKPALADTIRVKTVVAKESQDADGKYFSKHIVSVQVAGQDIQDVGPREATQGLMFLLIGGVLVGAAIFAFSN